MPKSLSKPSDFNRVYREGRSCSSGLLRIHYASGQGTGTRVAYVASRRVGKAVARNRARRVLREASRDAVRRAAPGHDIVFVAHPAVVDAAAQDVKATIARLMKRAGLLEEDR